MAGGQLALHVCAAVQQCSCDMTANHSSAAECLCSCYVKYTSCHLQGAGGGKGPFMCHLSQLMAAEGQSETAKRSTGAPSMYVCPPW